MENMKIYEATRIVPESAKKEILGGRLKGFTDINPMWRIKTLTELFGPCGIGWYYTIDETWTEYYSDGIEKSANVIISLYVKADGEWSKPIQAVGGSMFVSKERNGIYVNDECFKMALTDAISVACKSLGFGADIYWRKDSTKYSDTKKDNINSEAEALKNKPITKTHIEAIKTLAAETDTVVDDIVKAYGKNALDEMSEAEASDVMNILVRRKNNK